MSQLSRTHKTFLLAAVGLALGIQNIAFNLGTHGVVFYNRLLPIWAISVAVLLGVLALPAEERPINRLGQLALGAPSLWLLLMIFGNNKPNWNWFDELIFAVGLGVVFVILPYTAYLLISITQSETLVLPKRYFFYLLGIALFVGLLTFLMGYNHDLLLTCQDFAIAGDAQPEDCFIPE